jgi:hypothetical protein
MKEEEKKMKENTPIDENTGRSQVVKTLKLSEKAGSAVVLSFGRMNPITSGHQKLVDKINSVARKKKATAQLYLSHSSDKKKNPLTYDQKIKFAKKAFGNIVQKSPARTIIEVLKELDGTFDNVTIVVGSDRVNEFKTLVTKYNGKDYAFENIDIVSAGERDPDADDVSGMSASKLRALAVAGEYKQFSQGVPRAFKDRDTKQVYNIIRNAMGITEDLSLDEVLNLQQRMKRKMMFRRIKGKIKRGRALAQRRMANKDKLKTRAQRKARQLVRTKLAGKQGEKYKDLPLATRAAIDKKLEKKKALISRIATRLVPKVTKAERERLASYRKSKSQREEYYTDSDYLRTVNEMLYVIEKERMTESIEKNLQKKSEKYGLSFEEIKERYINYKLGNQGINETFQKLNVELANEQKEEVRQSLQYHLDNEIPLAENIFRVGSVNYYKLFNEARKSQHQFADYDRSILATDIGEFAQYDNEWVPLDCPMMESINEEEEKKELNKPKRGGPKKFYVYVKDPSTGNIKKVTFGDTTGLKAKIDNPEARKSFAARHKCSTQTDKTSAAYWACRLPRYAKQLGLSGGGNFFW